MAGDPSNHGATVVRWATTRQGADAPDRAWRGVERSQSGRLSRCTRAPTNAEANPGVLPLSAARRRRQHDGGLMAMRNRSERGGIPRAVGLIALPAVAALTLAPPASAARIGAHGNRSIGI